MDADPVQDPYLLYINNQVANNLPNIGGADEAQSREHARQFFEQAVELADIDGYLLDGEKELIVSDLLDAWDNDDGIFAIEDDWDNGTSPDETRLEPAVDDAALEQLGITRDQLEAFYRNMELLDGRVDRTSLPTVGLMNAVANLAASSVRAAHLDYERITRAREAMLARESGQRQDPEPAEG